MDKRTLGQFSTCVTRTSRSHIDHSMERDCLQSPTRSFGQRCLPSFRSARMKSTSLSQAICQASLILGAGRVECPAESGRGLDTAIGVIAIWEPRGCGLHPHEEATRLTNTIDSPLVGKVCVYLCCHPIYSGRQVCGRTSRGSHR